MFTRFALNRPFPVLVTLVTCTLLTPSDGVVAAEIDAKSPSLIDVTAAITLAKDGDIVKVPAGAVTWTSTLSITKNVTLLGAGPSLTVITNGITGPASRPPLVKIDLSRDLPFRLSGFTFRGGVATALNFNGEIRIGGICHSLRVDNCTFDNLHGTGVSISGFQWGVVDHCNFYATGTILVLFRSCMQTGMGRIGGMVPGRTTLTGEARSSYLLKIVTWKARGLIPLRALVL